MTLIDNSDYLACWSNGYPRGDIYDLSIELYRHRSGKWFVRHFGGAAMSRGQLRWIDRAEAVSFIANYCSDPVSGYGFTTEQAEIMVDGGDAGRGQRDFEGRILPPPPYCSPA